MIIAQATMPFYTVYGIYLAIKKKDKTELIAEINNKAEEKEEIYNN